ncbi:hypothetical protein [Haloglomus halophilum]|uniref:hypothetical protein n=1 Tax=Haloglomus halophilum TaxID=2962672 RepID=UPI0020C9B716|nr:hypothetical protein [Haloglomus halophilum]
MEYGVVTRNAEELEWPEFDVGFYEVKSVAGKPSEPEAGAVNMVSCFADNAAATGNPDLVPEDPAGRKATRERDYFDWDYIDPSVADYKRGLLDIVEDCAEVNGDVRLDDVGWPRAEYCHCDRCDAAFADSGFEEREAWRAEVITDFVATAREHVPGDLYLTVYPDPYPGHLYERSGLDLDALAEYVDEFVVPIYDMAYSTTYWLEILASAWADRCAELDTPFSVELYAVNVDLDDLTKAVRVAGEYGDRVLFGYDASQARATLRRMDAESRPGVDHSSDP